MLIVDIVSKPDLGGRWPLGGSSQMNDRDPIARPRGTLYVSSEAAGDMRLTIGTAHYSYGIVARRFVRVLRRLDHRVVFLAMPEKYKRRQDLEREGSDVPERPIHICFRSTENLRPLPLGFNICHFAWEFDALSGEVLVQEPVTKSQRHMLGLMDEIWVPSAYTKKVLSAHGFANVHVVPTPVCADALPERLSRAAAIESIGPLATLPFFMSSAIIDEDNAALAKGMNLALADVPAVRTALENNGKVFLAVCNPGDRRKNLLNLVDGFLMATRDRDCDVLIVKLAVPMQKVLFEDSPFEHLRPRFNGPAAVYHPRVVLLCEYLRSEEMSALYSLADYYVSPSHCEGHNLPLLEAMAHGTLAVTTNNTAMSDYVGAENAVVIAERRYLGVVAEMASEVSGSSPVVSFADRFDIARAIRTALDLAPEDHAAKTASGRAMVLDRYGEQAVMRLLEARLNACEAQLGDQSRVL